MADDGIPVLPERAVREPPRDRQAIERRAQHVAEPDRALETAAARQ